VLFLLFAGDSRKKVWIESWLSLADWSSFLPALTRLATYRNPVANSWTAKPRTSRAGFGRDGQTFPGFCHQLRAPWMPGSLVPPVEPVYVPLSRRSYYQDGSRASDLRTRIVSVQPPKSKMERFLSRPARCRLRTSCEDEARRKEMRLIQKSASGSISGCSLARSIRETPGIWFRAETASWFLR